MILLSVVTVSAATQINQGEVMGTVKEKLLSRKEAFFGLHFDLHPTKDDTQLGEQITDDMIARLLKKVQPDYVQYDCKGHPGYAGYPTKIGWPSPGIKKDSLAIWRKVTREHGVALFIHYSGVWDSVAIEHHSEWACIDAAGNLDKNATSTFGPYCDELLIPQLKEAIDAYDLNGAWVDSDSWGVKLDFSPAARVAFTKATGIKDIPTKYGDTYWAEYMDFQRKHFREYVHKYVDAIHAHKPGFEITSNWMYSTFIPDPVTAPIVDFVSGDFSYNDAVDTARLEARYISSTGMPWDLMALGTNKGDNCEYGWTFKTARQLKQEASVVLVQGGGFQVVYHPTRSGWIEDWLIDIMAEVAKFCRERQAVSHKTQPVPQVALLFSSKSIYSAYDEFGRLFGWGWSAAPLNPIRGVLSALLELQYSVDIMVEHKLMENLSRYPVVVLPECHTLPDELRSALLDYVRKGGQLLIVGVESAALFKDELGVAYVDEPSEIGTFVKAGGVTAWLGGVWQKVKPTTARTVGEHYPMNSHINVIECLSESLRQDMREKGECAATINRYGKGQIGAIYGPLGNVHQRSHYPVVRQFLGEVMQQLFPEPMVKLKSPPCVDVSLRCDSDRLLIHLANTAGMQVSPRYAVIDFTPSIGPLELTVRLDKEPRKVSLVPADCDIETHWSNGKLRVTLPKLDIHNVVVIE